MQDKSLNFVKRLEDGEALRAKFTQRAALKTRVFDVLSEINDLLTEGMELDLSVGDAVEFFKLADEVGFLSFHHKKTGLIRFALAGFPTT